ncbi:MAG TPA: CPBP family intramembrane metalloprotease [Phaeodactylibacter sp.]|nr:CPBP family intramembrane metalloprotease [Phaeodactylibacter sp.]
MFFSRFVWKKTIMELDKDDIEDKDIGLPVVRALLLLLLTVVVFGLFGLLVIHMIGLANDMDLYSLIAELGAESTAKERNLFRLTILLNHLTMFVFPGIAFCAFVYRKRCMRFMGLRQMPSTTNVLGGVLLLLLSFPFVQFLFWLNQNHLPLPAWAVHIEEETASRIQHLLTSESGYEFAFNTLVIALIPAIGEELIFRGILQKLLGNAVRHMTIGIWISAIAFSAFHMQFEGFLPRLMLGLLLGYLYYWSGNLWVPIFAHFMNNFLQIATHFLFQDKLPEVNLDQMEQISVWQWLPSFLLMLGMGYYLQLYNARRKQTKTTIL